MVYHVILNANAGTANAIGVTEDELEALFSANGLEATIDARSAVPMQERIDAAMASAAEVIVAAGGDGTITALAAALVGSDKGLAILPLGTVNALAKDLKIPLELPEAVAALATGVSQRIDVGEVNGRVFLHKVVIGLIPGVAAAREHIRGRRDAGAKIGFLRHFFRRLARARRIAVAMQTSDGATRVERVQAVAVSNNAYDEGPGQFFSRQSLDRGTLTLYVLSHFTVFDFIRLTTGMLLGRWRHDQVLTVDSVTSVTITTRKPLIKVMFDGEVEMLETPLAFKTRPLALSVIVPAATDMLATAAIVEAAGGPTP
ncbi:diacylglycerol/lipid kinase family protein [Devosia limi]|nr:diacylglycerol kinase family protein [Devosia limi]SHE34525.1 Diacylglycerol kinase family enzyme [Devosia limi DSM 17137]